MRTRFGLVLLGLSACAAHTSAPVAPVDAAPALAPAAASPAPVASPLAPIQARRDEDASPGPGLSPDAPRDQPVSLRGKSQLDEVHAAMAPYVEKGRKTYPDAKKRYLAGLPPGHTFFVVKQLRDPGGSTEQVFIAVARIDNGHIFGRIASDILGLKAFKRGDPCDFPEADLLDWLISRPDGSEEGNVVGNFLDEWQKTRPSR